MALTNEGEFYTKGWRSVMAGNDPRYSFTRPDQMTAQQSEAYNAGALDAMEAEEGDEPDPQAAGYNEPDWETRDEV